MITAFTTTVYTVSGLYFWRVVLCTGAYTGSFLLCDSNKRVSLGHDVQLVKKLCFLLQNCLVKVYIHGCLAGAFVICVHSVCIQDNKAVREACALCLVQLFKYITTGEGDRLGQGTQIMLHSFALDSPSCGQYIFPHRHWFHVEQSHYRPHINSLS